MAISTTSTAAALVLLTTACGQVVGDLGVTHADPGRPAPNVSDASVADSGNEPLYPSCHPDAGTSRVARKSLPQGETGYFISEEFGPNSLPCGLYTMVYDGPTTRTDPGNARVLFERAGSRGVAGTVLFTVEYDWRTQVPFLTGPPYRLDVGGYFTMLINNANTGVTDLWVLQYLFDGRPFVL